MRIRIENKPLKWLGQNLFPLYIYQRLPMIVLLAVADGYFVAEHEYLYVVLSFVITIGLAYLYKYIAIKDSHVTTMRNLIKNLDRKSISNCFTLRRGRM